jgi:hypothetical protein
MEGSVTLVAQRSLAHRYVISLRRLLFIEKLGGKFLQLRFEDLAHRYQGTVLNLWMDMSGGKAKERFD